MAVIEINQASNPKQLKILQAKAKKVKAVIDAKEVITDLVDTANEHYPRCLGLAANQIWKGDLNKIPAIYLILWENIQEDFKKRWNIFINPEGKGTGPNIKDYEACMSFKGRASRIKKRKKNYTIKFLTVEGLIETIKISGRLARIAQHEADHLNGVLLWKNG